MAAVELADLEVPKGREDLALEPLLVVADGVLVLLVLDQREPARRVGAHGDLAVLDGGEQHPLRAQDASCVLVRCLLAREERTPALASASR